MAGAKATAVLNSRGAVVRSEDGKTLVSHPPAHLTVPAPQVDDALIFRKPTGGYRFNKLFLRLVGFPERVEFRVLPQTLPSTEQSPVRPIRKQLSEIRLPPCAAQSQAISTEN